MQIHKRRIAIAILQCYKSRFGRFVKKKTQQCLTSVEEVINVYAGFQQCLTSVEEVINVYAGFQQCLTSVEEVINVYAGFQEVVLEWREVYLVEDEVLEGLLQVRVSHQQRPHQATSLQHRLHVLQTWGKKMCI